VVITGPGIDATPDDGENKVNKGGAVVARVWYDDYGTPRIYAPEDVNHDGVVDQADHAEFVRLYDLAGAGSGPTLRDAQRYRNQTDWNKDGTVGPEDLAAFTADWHEAMLTPPRLEQELGNLPLYAGYWWDANLKLYHVRHRVYDPKMARWLQRDPLGYDAGGNLYSYVLNQPGRFTDPMGLMLQAPPGEGQDECQRKKRWVNQPSTPAALARGFYMNLGNLFGDPATINQPAGPTPAAPRSQGPNQGTNPIEEAMHALDVAERTGNSSLGRLSTNRFTESGLREATEKLAATMTVAQIAGAMALPSIDLLLGVESVIDNPKDWMAWAGVLPFVPAAIRELHASTLEHAVVQSVGKEYNSAILKSNLERFGIRGEGPVVAHHIVGNSELAKQIIHDILAKVGIDINDAANGMLLDPEFHKTLGTKEYREFVVDRISGLNTRQEVLSTLDSIKGDLLAKQEQFLKNGERPSFGRCTGIREVAH
jgi:RHS repeat-associated protein